MLAPFRRLLPYLLPYWRLYAIGSVCVIASVALRFMIPFLLGDSIDALRDEGDAADPAEADRLRGLIVLAALGMVAAAVVGSVTRTVSRLTILGNSRRAVHDVRRDVFAHLVRLSPSFYVRHRTGHIMSRCVNDMQNVQGMLGPVFMYLVETGVLFGVGLAFMLATSPLATVVGLAPFPFFLFAAKRVAHRVQEGSRAAQEMLGEVSAKVDESLSGHRVVKSLVIEEYDSAVFASLSSGYAATVLSVARLRATMTSWMTFLAATSTFLVLAVGAPLVRDGQVTVGELISLVLYLGMLAAPTRTLGFILSSMQRSAAALTRIGELLDMPVTIETRADTERPLQAGGPIVDGAIEVRDLTVEFASPDTLPHLSGSIPPDTISGRRRVLDRVSFSVRAGTTVGIVGPTGAGKTTLLCALVRLVEIDPGCVFFDGRDITDIPLVELRSSVGLAPQDAFLFSDTVENNVRFAVPDADRARVLRAVEISQLTADLDQLPEGLDTMLGERGVNLSGGQRQRTSLARVVLQRPRVLLLDDTLSAVDTHTSEAILNGLRPVMAGRTTIVVAHRLSTVEHADQILVLDDGQISESGTHAELIALGGYYASIYRRQSTHRGLAEQLGLEDES